MWRDYIIHSKWNGLDNLLVSARPVKVCYMEDQYALRHTLLTGLEEASGYLVDIISRNAKVQSSRRPNPTGIGIDADITVTELG
jgi:hypothetical protein